MRHIVAAAIFRSPLFPKSRSSVKAVRLKHNLAASPILSDIPATSSRIELESSGTAGVGAKDDSPLTSSLPSLSAVAHEHLRPRRLSPFGVECLSRGRTPSSAARRIGHLEMAGKASDKAKLQQGFGHPQAGLPSRFEWVFTAASPPTNSRPSPCKPVPCDNTPLGGLDHRHASPQGGFRGGAATISWETAGGAVPPGNRWGAVLAAGSRGDRSPTCRTPRRLRRNLTRISAPPGDRLAKRGVPARTRQTLPQPPSTRRHRRWSADHSA